MAQINVSNLTFGYEGSFDFVFENVSFAFDSNWKLGLIGRNGKGKTTLAKLLMGEYSYQGSLTTSGVHFDYFPYEQNNDSMRTGAEWIEIWKPECEQWRVICELNSMQVDPEILYRPFHSLSFGEQTKVMLATLFAGENEFVILDEPTNHLDVQTRQNVKTYLKGKKSFLLISHDRDLLDACVDHLLVLNRVSVEVQTGNFSSWWENKQRKDAFAQEENEKHLHQIQKLHTAMEQSGQWAQKNEATKIGFNPIKEHDRFKDTRCYIGAKTKKMQSRVKNYEKRMEREIQQKEGLLQDIEKETPLRLMPVSYHKKRYVSVRNLCLKYPGAKCALTDKLSFEILAGERVCLRGANGCGKSTLIKEILAKNEQDETYQSTIQQGEIEVGSGIVISYINQDTSFLKGSMKKYCQEKDLDEKTFLAILRQLDFEREQFDKPMEQYSQGQKKKVLIAASLLQPAHLYIWDEPLNYIDVYSRMQLEKLLLQYQPTLLFVEHDVRFMEKIATKVIEM